MALQFARKINQALYSAEYLTGLASHQDSTPKRRSVLGAAIVQAELAALAFLCELMSLNKSRAQTARKLLLDGSLSVALSAITEEDSQAACQLASSGAQADSWLSGILEAARQYREPDSQVGIHNPLFESDLVPEQPAPAAEGLIRVVDESAAAPGPSDLFDAQRLAALLGVFRQAVADYRSQSEEF